MTNLEFNNEFDILYNNITSNQAPGLDTYEKSVFLTKAQDEIIKAYFEPKTNKIQEGFDGNEIRQIDFSMIMRSKTFNNFKAPLFDTRTNTKAIELDKDIFIITNEYITVTRDNKSTRLTVIPINYNEYNRLMSRPYKRPLKFHAWRLIDNSNTKAEVELIAGPNDIITQYTIRYIKRPNPIILENLDNGLSLGNGITIETPCELDPILHHEILQRAVELAKSVYMGDLSSQLTLGQISQTNVGMLTKGN